MIAAAIEGGAFSVTNENSEDFFSTCIQTSYRFIRLSFDRKRRIKSLGFEHSNFTSFIISLKCLQPFVIVVIFKLNIFAISFADRGTLLLLHDMYIEDAISPLLLLPLVILSDDNFEYSKEENGELDEEKDDLNDVELPRTDREQKEKDVQESQTSTEFLQDDQKSIEERQFHSEQETNAYDAGYKAALDEFEKSMQMEKSSLQDIIQTMYSVGEQFQDNLEKLIKDQITELASELIGTHLQEFEESYINKIKVAADNILKDAADIKLELNHMDFELLKSNSNFAALAFEVTDEKDLRRGEFRLIANSSGFQQKYID